MRSQPLCNIIFEGTRGEDDVGHPWILFEKWAGTDGSWVEDRQRRGSRVGRHWERYSERKETGGSALGYMSHYGLCMQTP
jgi:hypothetical protein